MLVAFAGLNAFTSVPHAETIKTKIIKAGGGNITARMLHNGLTLVSWTSLSEGGTTSVSVTNMTTGSSVFSTVPENVNSTTFAGLQTNQLYRFKVENAHTNIIIIDIIDM